MNKVWMTIKGDGVDGLLPPDRHGPRHNKRPRSPRVIRIPSPLIQARPRETTDDSSSFPYKCTPVGSYSLETHSRDQLGR